MKGADYGKLQVGVQVGEGGGVVSYLQAKEDLALYLKAFVQEGFQVAPPLSLLAQAACLLAQLSLSLHQLTPNLPAAGVGMRCLITLQPALDTLNQPSLPWVMFGCIDDG